MHSSSSVNYYIIEIQHGDDRLVLLLYRRYMHTTMCLAADFILNAHLNNIYYILACEVGSDKLLFIITVQLRCAILRTHTRWSPTATECEFYDRDPRTALYNCFCVRFSMNRDRSCGRGSNMLIGITDIIKEHRVQPSYNMFIDINVH